MCILWRGLSEPLDNARPHSERRSVSVVCLLWRFGATSWRHAQCLFVWVFVTIYGNNWYCYQWTSFVNPISLFVKTLCEAFLRAWSTTDLYSNVWKLIDSEFDTLNYLFYFYIQKNLLWSRGNDQTWVVTYFVEKDSVLSHDWDNLCIVTHLDV